jgi:hypothetical protein
MKEDIFPRIPGQHHEIHYAWPIEIGERILEMQIED